MTAIHSGRSTLRRDPHTVGYYLLMGGIFLLVTRLWLSHGQYLLTAWFPSLYEGLTPINGVMTGAFLTLMLLCALLSLVRPRTYPEATTILLVGGTTVGLMVPLTFVREAPLRSAGALLFVGLIIGLLLRLHPQRDSVLPSFDGAMSTPLVGLTLFLLIPFVWITVDMQWAQITRDNAVAEQWFYGQFAVYLTTCVVCCILATFDEGIRPIAASIAVYLVSVLGLVSMVYPNALHSLGTTGGALLLLWSIALGALLLAE